MVGTLREEGRVVEDDEAGETPRKVCGAAADAIHTLSSRDLFKN